MLEGTLVLTTGVLNTTSVPGIVNKDDVTRSAVLSKEGERIENVLVSRRFMVTVVHQDQHVLLLKTLTLDEISFNIFNIVVATTELPPLTCVLNFRLFFFRHFCSQYKTKAQRHSKTYQRS